VQTPTRLITAMMPPVDAAGSAALQSAIGAVGSSLSSRSPLADA
jgi:hypothetical protein